MRAEIDEVIVQSTLLRGSDPFYEIDFGDNSPPESFNQNSTRTSPFLPDVRYFRHVYDVPGNYAVSLSVENIFGSGQSNLSELIVVQNSLETKFVLKPNEIKTVSYPPGSVTFDSDLIKTSSSITEGVPTTGWANNVHARWYQHTDDEYDKLLLTSYGNFEIGKLH